MITQIPFDGFYNSFYSDAIDREEEQYIEWKQEDRIINQEQASELANVLFRHTNYGQAYEALAKAYVDGFNNRFKQWTGISLGITFESVHSPREYNFTTDRIFCHISEEVVKALFEKVDRAEFDKQIRERFTSRSGFISHYPNRLEEWPEDLGEWDWNHICTLIMAFLPEDWRWDMFYEVCDGDTPYHAWEKAVNWKEVEKFFEEQGITV